MVQEQRNEPTFEGIGITVTARYVEGEPPRYTPRPPPPGTKDTCPSCGVKLDPVPKRKKACPSCREPIYVRRGTLVAEYEAMKDDYVGNYGIDLAAWEPVRQRLRAQQDGPEPSVEEVAWACMQEKIASALADKRLACNGLALVYHSAAMLAVALGKEDFELRQLHHATRIRDAIGPVGIRGGCCSACTRDEGKQFTVAEAREKRILPHRDCENPPCRCTYRLKGGDLVRVDQPPE